MAVFSPDSQAAVVASPQDLANLHVTQLLKRNSVALKGIRDSHADPPGNPTTDCLDLTFSDPYEIGVMEKSTGMEYKFKYGERKPWAWRHILAVWRQGAKDVVLSSPALGVIRITCEPVPRSNDHKRCQVARKFGRLYAEDVEVLVWVFSLRAPMAP